MRGRPPRSRIVIAKVALLVGCSSPPVLPTPSPQQGSAAPSSAAPVATRDPRVRFEDAAKLKATFAWGPSGTLLVVAGDTLETFDADGHLVAETRFPIPGPIDELQISRDGRAGLVLTSDEWLGVSTTDWAVQGRGSSGRASCVLMSPDGTRFAARHEDDALVLVDVADAKPRVVGHGCPVGWSADGRWLAVSFDSDGADPPRSTIGLWKDGDAAISPFLADTNISTAALSEDGSRVLIARRDREAVRLYARAAGGSAPPIAAHEFDLPRVARVRSREVSTSWNPLGHDAVAFDGGIVRRPDAGRGLEGLVFDAGRRWEDRRVDVEGLALDTTRPAPRWIAAQCGAEAPFVKARRASRVCVWRVANGERVRFPSRGVELTTALVGIARDEAGTVLAAKGADGSVRAWDLRSGAFGSLLGIASPEPRERFDSVFAIDRAHVQVAAGPGRVVAWGDGGPVHVWEARTSVWRTVDRPTGVFDVDAHWMVHMQDGTAIVTAIDGAVVGTFEVPTDLAGISVAPTGDAVALWTTRGNVAVRALPAGGSEPFGPFEIDAVPTRVAFSPGGRFLDVTTSGGTSLLLDRTTRAASATRCAGGPTFESRGGFVDVLRVDASSCVGWGQQPSLCEKTVLDRRRADGSCEGEPLQVVAPSRSVDGLWVGRAADVDDEQWLRTAAPAWSAESSVDGRITLGFADGSRLYLRALRGLDAGFVYTDDGAFDILGRDADAAMESVFCTVAASGSDAPPRPARGAACAGARVRGLLRDALERAQRPAP